jgi:hypothetical protein
VSGWVSKAAMASREVSKEDRSGRLQLCRLDWSSSLAVGCRMLSNRRLGTSPFADRDKDSLQLRRTLASERAEVVRVAVLANSRSSRADLSGQVAETSAADAHNAFATGKKSNSAPGSTSGDGQWIIRKG